MNKIQYIYKDPTLPDLIGPVELPSAPKNCQFKVDGFRGATDAMYTLEHQAACCHVSIVHAINLANRYLEVPITAWSSVPRLLVLPRAGKQFNAYYDRIALRFFYATDPITRKMVYTSNAADVTVHEIGHALLDAMRPELYNTPSMEIWAYHEFFGDFDVLINSLQHDIILDYLLKQTGGNLRQSNVCSELARELGVAIYHATGGRGGRIDGALRNAFNTFVYVPPETLPPSGPDNKICAEPHNFSRIFTGTWYDILVGIYEDQRKTLAPKDALIAARDILGKYTFRAMRVAAAAVKFYDAAAKAMLVIDKANGYRYNQLMNNIFIKRGILRNPVKPMVAMDWDMFKSQVEPADEVIKEKDIIVVRSKKTELLPLPHHMLNVEMPNDTFYEFNAGQCVDIVSTNPEDLVEHAHHCVEYLKANDLIRPDKLTPFEIDDEGNLIRTHFACGVDDDYESYTGCGCTCGANNCHNPQAPEYGKCWKSKNNAGCGCHKCKNCDEDYDAMTIIQQKNMRPH